jgi:8-oxo-dGTP diphosphatase
VPDTTATVILRHAEAVKRAVWRESDDPLADDDALRPLSPEGNERAAGLVAMLGAYGVRRVVSSDARRCRATVEPYADEHGLAVEVAWTLSEQGAEFDPGETAQTVAALLDHVGPTVWCTHRPVLPFVVAAVARTLGLDPRDDRLDPRLRPGAALVLHRDPGGGIVAVDRLEPGP